MMAALREWLFSLICVSLVLSLVQILIPEGSLRKAAEFAGGLILLAALLQPILRIDPRDLEAGDWGSELRRSQEELEAVRREELAAGIARRTETYIWDKAAALGVFPTAVQVTAEPGPEGVPLPVAAAVGAPRNQALAEYMERELGIPQERQAWSEVEK